MNIIAGSKLNIPTFSPDVIIIIFSDYNYQKSLFFKGLSLVFHDHAKHPDHDHYFYPLPKVSLAINLQRLNACQKRGKNFHDKYPLLEKSCTIARTVLNSELRE